MAQYQYVPERLIYGLSTARINTLFGDYPKPNPVAALYYENDFLTYAAADWTVAPATGTSALSNANGLAGGFLRQTTGAVSTNAQGNALSTPSYLFTGGNTFGGKVWFACGFIEAASLVTSWTIGMTVGGADAPTSGVYFTRATTASAISLVLNKAGTLTTIALPGVASVISANVSLGFFYDGKPTPTLYAFCSLPLATPTQFGQPYWQGGVAVTSASNDPSNVNPLTNLPNVLITPSFAARTNAASAVSMDFDYIVAAQEIPTRF